MGLRSPISPPPRGAKVWGASPAAMLEPAWGARQQGPARAPRAARRRCTVVWGGGRAARDVRCPKGFAPGLCSARHGAAQHTNGSRLQGQGRHQAQMCCVPMYVCLASGGAARIALGFCADSRTRCTLRALFNEWPMEWAWALDQFVCAQGGRVSHMHRGGGEVKQAFCARPVAHSGKVTSPSCSAVGVPRHSPRRPPRGTR